NFVRYMALRKSPSSSMDVIARRCSKAFVIEAGDSPVDAMREHALLWKPGSSGASQKSRSPSPLRTRCLGQPAQPRGAVGGPRGRGRRPGGGLPARARLAAEAELVDRPPEVQAALAGRVDVRGTHDLVAAAQRGPQRLDDVADLRLLLALPREVVEVPRQVV